MLANPVITTDNPSIVSAEKSLTFYPAGKMKLHSHAIVLVHGWGANSEIWQGLPQTLSDFADIYTVDLPGFGSCPPIEDYSEPSLMDWLQNQLPQPCYLVGLSLGGMLCRAYAANFPDKVLGLITISTNLKFVADNQYPTAMPKADFELFSAIWDQNPSACLARFSGLQAQGDQRQRQLIRQLRNMSLDIDAVAGRDMLRLLADIDGTQQIEQIKCPSLAIFGAQDCLVPVAASQQLPVSHNSMLIESAGHLPHLSAQSQVVDKIRTFIDRSKYQLDKNQVAQSFGRAAETYDSAAHIQKWSGDQLLSDLNGGQNFKSIVDLGCGTGTQSALLKKQFPQAQITGVDFSSQMLAYASAQQTDIDWLCCDAEDLAVDDQSQDLIFSNFALQWCNDPNPSLAEIYRVLNSQGQFHFAIPGPQTLWELREVWGQIDRDIHINRFLSSCQWQEALETAGFTKIELTHTTKIEYHPSVKALLWNLKAVGATNHNSGKAKHLTGKAQIKRLYETYRQFETSQGTFPATWDIIFGCAVK